MRPVGPPVLRCDGVVHIYRSGGTEVVALRGLDLAVEEGSTVALSGPSGAGKSTLLWLIAGLMGPSAGRIWVHDQEVTRLSTSELDRLRAERLGIVLQNPTRNLLPHATARQNLDFAQRAGPGRRRDRRKLADDLLEEMGLGGIAGRHAGGLSGGEQQRLAVAVALVNRPRLLLADEPTNQLDRALARDVATLLATAPERFGTTLVAVTHDPVLAQACERSLTIRDGVVGTEAVGGEDHVVVGAAGAVTLPPQALEVLPPGSRARVRTEPDGVWLGRANEEGPAE